MAEDHYEDCDCLFCSTRCPNCGGVNVQVEYVAKFSLMNDTPNQINIDFDDSVARVFCSDCGGPDEDTDSMYRDLNDIHFWLNEGRDNPKLAYAISHILDIGNLKCKFEDDGQIKVTHWNMTSPDKPNKRMVPGPIPKRR